MLRVLKDGNRSREVGTGSSAGSIQETNVSSVVASKLPIVLDRSVSLECRHLDAGGGPGLAGAAINKLGILAGT